MTSTDASIKRIARVKKATPNKKTPSKKIKAYEEPGSIEGRGVVYVKHIPHGFYEEQMKEYFQQFGKVTRLRLSRSKKTGQSKGYAYVEFASEDVAKIAADSMSDYLMFRQRLMCKVIDPATLHPSTFKGCNRKFTTPKSSAIARERHNRPITESQQVERAERLKRKNAKQLAAFRELGIDYDMIIADEKVLTAKKTKKQAAGSKAVTGETGVIRKSKRKQDAEVAVTVEKVSQNETKNKNSNKSKDSNKSMDNNKRVKRIKLE